MTRIVYNDCYGGFSLSEAAIARYKELAWGTQSVEWYDREVERTDPILLQVIDEIGLKAASGSHARLAIRELPAGTIYRIDEYDGYESVMTQDEDEYEWRTA